LSGTELVPGLRSKDSNIALVVASGGCEQSAIDHLNGLDVRAFLGKPFTVAQLLKAIIDAGAGWKVPEPTELFSRAA